MIYAIIAVVVILLIIGGMYNSLVVLRNKAKNQFANIDAILQTRADLIPNLVETVKGYAKHEEGTFTKVIEARNKYVSASSMEEKIESQGAIEGALSKLFALSEAYPELKANQNFMDLQNQLSEVEEKVRFARQFYNDAVTIYNTKIEVVPSNIIAAMFKFKAMKLFEASEGAKVAPKVQF